MTIFDGSVSAYSDRNAIDLSGVAWIDNLGLYLSQLYIAPSCTAKVNFYFHFSALTPNNIRSPVVRVFPTIQGERKLWERAGIEPEASHSTSAGTSH